MKKIFLFIATIAAFGLKGYAQLADGSTVPDFTFTDINGVSRHLYAILDSGKYVALDISTTWCNPCWLYHNTHTFDSLYSLHDVAGDNSWRVFFIEGDGNTDSAELHGSGTSTQGDWVAGAQYPIIDPPTGASLNDFTIAYGISSYPTFLLICPNRKVYQDTLNSVLKPAVSTWEYAASHNTCAISGIGETEQIQGGIAVYPNPASNEVQLDFGNNLKNYKVFITNILGTIIETEFFDNNVAGKRSLTINTSLLPDGVYIVSLSGINGTIARKELVIMH